MTGVINADLEPMLRLTIRDAVGQPHDVESVIDTGFIGMAMMQGSELRIQIMPGGSVTIAGFP